MDCLLTPLAEKLLVRHHHRRFAGSAAFPQNQTRRKDRVRVEGLLRIALPFLLLAGSVTPVAAEEAAAHMEALPGSQPLALQGDIASAMIEGIDRFLLREIAASIGRRGEHWQRDCSSREAYRRSIAPNRKRLRHILGMRDPRIPFDGLQLVSTTEQPALVGQSEKVSIYAVRWPAVEHVDGEGLLLVPRDRKPVADMVCLPDCEQTPEMLAGIEQGVPAASQFALRLAESGCRVVVPLLIDRGHQYSVGQDGKSPTKITHREFLYRPAFELGRHLIGYELQEVLAIVDWFEQEPGSGQRKVGVVGYGEGGMLALYAGAVDPRIDAVGVSGYFDSRQRIWGEPLDRNVFGLLEQFGDAELAAMIAPRPLLIEAAKVPEVEIPTGTGGGPGQTGTPPPERVRLEARRAEALCDFEQDWRIAITVSEKGSGPFGTAGWLNGVLRAVASAAELASAVGQPEHLRKQYEPEKRLARQFAQIKLHTQLLLSESPYVREQFMAKLDRTANDLEKYRRSAQPYREYFRQEVVGSFDRELLPPQVRTRKIYDEPGYTGYEVMLDVFPDVFAYGILLIPKDIESGEQRPVVVCQHGLEGRPVDVITRTGRGFRYYKAFAAQLAERGFVTFAPQNIYIFKDRFRTLQRKANAVGKTLFSIMVPQHEQITRFLAALPQTDPERIAFYGLSYGGKSAMRIPPLVDNYCLSICSADFNEWVWKNASIRNPYSYAYRGEYEIFEFDLGSTFNYAEMAALICPRPFMVERGHRDGVSSDEAVAYEYAKVRLLYVDLGIPDRTRIEFFDGPHSINAAGTFEFLHKHLDWPRK